ncbi:MAG: hypothetical protein JNL58_17245 [Planctomyces sp.]|nr:hypothetical protein [Planctomyces sp.]
MLNAHLLFGIVLLLHCAVNSACHGSQEDELFSGPQQGEPLPALTMNGVYDESAGKPIDVSNKIGEGPGLIIFVHERTRPTFGLMNALLRFSETRRDKGLTTAACLLSADPTETENWLKQIRQYLPRERELLIGISPDGQEGPGTFGLNRNVAMTILVVEDQKVTANFTLVQPGIDVDGPKILKAVVDVTGGGEVPEIATFANAGRMNRDGSRPERSAAEQDPRLRPLLSKLIRKDATAEDVDAAAEAIKMFVKENPQTGPQIAAIANRIIDAGKLEDYGTPHAQRYLKDWSKSFAVTDDKKPKDSN